MGSRRLQLMQELQLFSVVLKYAALIPSGADSADRVFYA